MAWKAVHPSLTEEVRVLDDPDSPVFKVCFWPPKIAAEIEVRLARLRKPGRDLDPVNDYDLLLKESGLSLESFELMARYGVAGWSGFGEFECQTESETIDGRAHSRLTPDSLHLLHVNRLLLGVAMKALLMNTLSEDQRGKFNWRFGSSMTSRDMNAAGAAPASQPTRTEASPSESSETVPPSGSEGASST